MLVLEVRSHRNLTLEAAIADGAMVGQRLGVCREVFGQMILAKETFLADATLVRLHARVPHLVAPHIGAVGELHVAYIAFEDFAGCTAGTTTAAATTTAIATIARRRGAG